MKKYFLVFASFACMLSSCQKEVDTNAQVDEFTYTFALSSTETKSVIESDKLGTFVKWEDGDQLGTYVVSGSNISYNRYANIDVTKSPVMFNVSSYNAMTVGDKVYCYYPYSKTNSSDIYQKPSEILLEIPTAQSGKMDAMPMAGEPYTVTSPVDAKTDEPIGDIRMNNLAGVFQFNIYSSDATILNETVKYVEFDSTDPIAGSFTYDLTTQPSDISGYTEKTITVTNDVVIGADKDSADKTYMVVAPGSHTGILIVRTDKAIYTFELTSPKKVEKSHIKPINVDLANGEREAKVYPITVEMESFTNISGAVGGDASIQYEAGKGGASNAPVVNSGVIRVYQNGGTFSVKPNGGAIITDVVIGSAMKTKVDYSVDGGAVTEQSINAGAKLSINGISCEKEVLFTCKGTTSSDRLYVNYLKVSYLPSSTSAETKMITVSELNGLNPKGGSYNFDNAYSLVNIDEDSEEINVSHSDNIYDVTVYGGMVEFTMEPNYLNSTVNGTITLTLDSDPTVKGVINVQQSSSRLAVSSDTIVIPADSEEATFTITSKYFGWSITSSSDDLIFDESGIASDNATTVTVMSDIEASEEIQTIGTLTIIRNGNADDPQKAVVTVKKDKIGGDSKYVKVSSITSGKKYILVESYSNSDYICGGLITSKSLTVVAASNLIKDNSILSTTTTDSYAITITLDDESNTYTLTNSKGDTIRVNDGDLNTTAQTPSWEITKQTDGTFKFVNTATSTRALFIGNTGKSCKNYATSNLSKTGYASTYFDLYELDE